LISPTCRCANLGDVGLDDALTRPDGKDYTTRIVRAVRQGQASVP